MLCIFEPAKMAALLPRPACNRIVTCRVEVSLSASASLARLLRPEATEAERGGLLHRVHALASSGAQAASSFHYQSCEIEGVRTAVALLFGVQS